MADLPPPPPGGKDDLPDVTVVTMVHKVKSKLGYTEMHSQAPASALGDNQVDYNEEKVFFAFSED